MSNELRGTLSGDSDVMSCLEGYAAEDRHSAIGRRFVLLSMPRTGSSMVAAMLGTHPDIVCLPAVFSDKEWHAYSEGDEEAWEMTKRLQLLKPRWSRIEDRLADVDGFLRAADEVNRDRAAWGFKQHLGPRANERTARVVALGWPTILLRRDNILASYASNKIVKLTGQGAAKAGETLRTAQPHFDAEEFTKFRRRREQVYAYWEPLIDASGVPVLRIDYFQARTREGMGLLAGFLGLSPDLFGDWPTAKRNSDDIVARFTNAEEVLAYLTRHELPSWQREG